MSLRDVLALAHFHPAPRQQWLSTFDGNHKHNAPSSHHMSRRFRFLLMRSTSLTFIVLCMSIVSTNAVLLNRTEQKKQSKNIQPNLSYKFTILRTYKAMSIRQYSPDLTEFNRFWNLEFPSSDYNDRFFANNR